MPPWLPRVLRQIRAFAAAGRVVLTEKAVSELTELHLEFRDAAEIVSSLAASDRPARLRSDPPGEWLYVFRPVVGGLPLYIKVAIRADCVVISFHEDQTQEAAEDDDER